MREYGNDRYVLSSGLDEERVNQEILRNVVTYQRISQNPNLRHTFVIK